MGKQGKFSGDFKKYLAFSLVLLAVMSLYLILFFQKGIRVNDQFVPKVKSEVAGVDCYKNAYYKFCIQTSGEGIKQMTTETANEGIRTYTLTFKQHKADPSDERYDIKLTLEENTHYEGTYNMKTDQLRDKEGHVAIPSVSEVEAEDYRLIKLGLEGAEIRGKKECLIVAGLFLLVIMVAIYFPKMIRYDQETTIGISLLIILVVLIIGVI